MLKKKKFNHGMGFEIGAGTGNFTNLILKKGGHFICVDSLNNNIIYIINRVMNYLNNKTSLSTIKKCQLNN